MPELTDAQWLRAVAETLEATCCGCGARRMRGIADALASSTESAPVVIMCGKPAKTKSGEDALAELAKAAVKLGERHCEACGHPIRGQQDMDHGCPAKGMEGSTQ